MLYNINRSKKFLHPNKYVTRQQQISVRISVFLGPSFLYNYSYFWVHHFCTTIHIFGSLISVQLSKFLGPSLIFAWRILLSVRNYKRYFKIDQYLALLFRYNGACLSSSPPFLCSQWNIPFSNSMISANQETGL